jgi:hypothetical protein
MNNADALAASTYTAQPTATGVLVYAIGGGGGGGGSDGTQPQGGSGGNGGFGLYRAPISAPYTQPFFAGNGGNGGGAFAGGQSGQSSYFGPAPAPLLLATGGAGGQTPGTNGAYGAMPTGTLDLTVANSGPTNTTSEDASRNRAFTSPASSGQGGGGSPTGAPAAPGTRGFIAIYELF